jgi:hypothetical protein
MRTMRWVGMLGSASIRLFLAALAVVVVLIAVGGCGGGRADPKRGQGDVLTRGSADFAGHVIARVGRVAITKPELDHWMATLAGGDFYGFSGRAVPARLVSEPPDYAACVASLRRAAAKAQSGGVGTEGAASQGPMRLLEKCHELYVALRLQATAYLVEGRWTIAVAAALGVRASEAEVESKLRQIKAREYPGPGEFQRYLASSRRSLSDERFVVKLNVLELRLGKQLSTHAKQLELLEAGHRVTSETDCRTGYVVSHCSQFKSPKPLPRSAAVLLEQVGTLAGTK